MGNDNLKTFVRGAYDIQKLRIMEGQRIVSTFKVKLGIKPGEKEEDGLDAEGKVLLNGLKVDYHKIMDGLKKFPSPLRFKGQGNISDYTELCLMKSYLDLEHQEDEHFTLLGKVLKGYPIYVQFLEGVKGVGPAMAGVIISEIDIVKARTSSSIWKYAGLDVADDGRGRSRKAEHLVDVDYKNKNGEEDTRKSITFNPFLKTKLVGVLASSFLRVGDNKYRQIYDQYKHRLEHRADWLEKSKGHRHNAAMRYMIKQFLVDLYIAWRTIEGLEVSAPYHEAKLGHRHKGESRLAA